MRKLLLFLLVSIALLIVFLGDFRIHALHMYVLPHGCAHDESTLHLDHNQVFH